MATRFELRMIGMDAPPGQIEADRLIGILTSLREMAIRVGRLEIDAAAVGRPSRRLDRVSGLSIGLEGGSTTIVAERFVDPGVLDFDQPEEDAVDRRIEELIEGIADDQRPDWVNDSVANSAHDLVAALMRTAPTVEFRVNGVSRRSFDTAAIHRRTWEPVAVGAGPSTVTFTGPLFP